MALDTADNSDYSSINNKVLMNKFFHNGRRYKVVGGLLYRQEPGDTDPLIPVTETQGDKELERRAGQYGAKFHGV